MTYSQIILKFLKSNPDIWFREGKFHGLNTPWGLVGYRGDRTVRDLIKKKLVEDKMDGKFRVIRHKKSFVDEFIAKYPPRLQKTMEAKGFQSVKQTLGL